MGGCITLKVVAYAWTETLLKGIALTLGGEKYRDADGDCFDLPNDEFMNITRNMGLAVP